MSWKKIWIPALAIPIVALLGYGLTRDPNTIESPLPGREAFHFAGETLSGDSLSLDDLEGKVVVLNFWASWCVACIGEHPLFVEAERRFPGEEFQMLGVVYQDEPENARRWMQRRGGSWPNLLDPNSRIAIDYGVYGVPETYFIGRDGRIAYKQIGPVSQAVLNDWLTRLLAQTPDEEFTATEIDADGVPSGRSAGHTRSEQGVGGSQP